MGREMLQSQPDGISFDPEEFGPRALFEQHHYWHRHRRDVVFDAIRSLAPDRSGRILDMGCGVGTVANHLARRGYAVDCADAHSEAIHEAERGAAHTPNAQPSPRRYFVHDLCDPLPEHRYRGILLLDVLEHLADDHRALGHALAGLERGPDSFVIVTVPADPKLYGDWDRKEGHYRRYARADLKALLLAQGLCTVRLSNLFLPLRPALILTRALRDVRRVFLGPSAPVSLESWTETQHGFWASAGASRLLELERRWLQRHDLHWGTSLLAIARWA